MPALTPARKKITFADMHDMGVRGLLIYCSDYKCSHLVTMSGDRWPDDKVEKLIKDDPETLALWRETVIPGPGRPTEIRRNHTNNDRGRAYDLTRLKRSHPELFERVVAGWRKAMSALKQPDETPSDQVDKAGDQKRHGEIEAAHLLDGK